MSSSSKSILVVGLGGLGCPAALALVEAGVGCVMLCDDDVVEETNLHRQILFGPEDVGRDKLDAALRALEPAARRSGTRLEGIRARFLPDNARRLARSADVVVEGTDNYATKFLAADACHLEQRPVVHGAGIRWVATAWAVAGTGRPCYRCLFEDLPGGAQASCDSAGVMGPVVGFAGALMAELALRALNGAPTFGRVWTFDGKRARLREVALEPRPDCPLCGPRSTIVDVDESRYLSPTRAADTLVHGAPLPH